MPQGRRPRPAAPPLRCGVGSPPNADWDRSTDDSSNGAGGGFSPPPHWHDPNRPSIGRAGAVRARRGSGFGGGFGGGGGGAAAATTSATAVTAAANNAYLGHAQWQRG